MPRFTVTINEQILECLRSFPSFPLLLHDSHTSLCSCAHMKDIQLLCNHIPWHCGSWSRQLTQARSMGLPHRNFGLKTRSWVSPSLVAKVVKFKSQNSYCLHIDEAILWRQRPGSQEETSRDGVTDTPPPVFYYLIFCFQKPSSYLAFLFIWVF